MKKKRNLFAEINDGFDALAEMRKRIRPHAAGEIGDPKRTYRATKGKRKRK